jgi:CBS domain containing-hemolysin-like protein
MDLHLGYRFLLVGLIILINGFFAAGEACLLSVRQSRLRHMAEAGESGAQAALSLLANPERFLSVVQLGLTLASLVLGWAGEETMEQYLKGILSPVFPQTYGWILHTGSVLVAFMVISYLHIVIGEVVPKNLAIDKAERLAVLLAPPLLLFARVAGPFVAVIERSAGYVSSRLGVRGGSHRTSHTPEEIKHIVVASHAQGYLDQFEEEAMQRLLELRDLSAREIMTPRNAIAGAPVDSGLDDLLRIFHENKYSRIPIYERGLEHVIGIVYSKDLLEVWQQRRIANQTRRPAPQFNLRRLLRQPVVIPETKPLTQLIDTFRHSNSHMAIVVDEFGSVTGLLTLEDVLEQIFGEIEDEHDVKLAPLPVIWEELELDGATSIRDLETQYLIEVPTNAGFETLAGFILFRLGVIPSPGESVEEGDLKFTVLEMDKNRIVKVKVEKKPAEGA